MTATDSLKVKKRCTIYHESPTFLRRKCKISLVRWTGFVLPLEHPGGTEYVNSPQLQRFLDKNDKSPIRLFQCFCFPDLQEVVNGHVETTWLLVRLLQPLLLYYSPLSFQPNSSLTIFSTSSALPLQTKTDKALCGMYCVINLVICFVTSYPRMTGLVNG